MLELKENDDGREVTLQPDATLEIDLAENPTTGYRWTIVSDGKPACELVDDNFEAGRGTGQAGLHRWRFRAVKAGTCDIALAYRRSWEHDVAPARTFALKVRVEKQTA
jgi:inhibitor of cysteine peptidase